MTEKIQLTADQIQALLRRMIGTHGKDAAVAWLRDEWVRQPEAMFDAFISAGGSRTPE